MASSIGPINFTIMKNDSFPSLQLRTEVIDRPGVDGHSSRRNADRADLASPMTVFDAIDEAAAEAAKVAQEALRGTIQTVIDSRGQTHENMLILEVNAQIRPTLFYSGGLQINDGDPGFIVTTQWQIQRLQ